MHKKGTSDGENILSSIQNLKHKLRLDQKQLQEIKHEMSRGKSSSIIKERLPLRTERNDDKENNSALANMNQPKDEFRKCKPLQQQLQRQSEVSPDIRMIELRKQQKAQMKDLTDRHNEQLMAIKEEGKRQLQRLRHHYDEVIREKEAHIRFLEDTLAEDVREQQSNEYFEEKQSIKQQYEDEIRRIKESYETIINNLSEENQQLIKERELHQKQETATHNDLTFKNVKLILKNSRNIDVPVRLQAKIVESHNTSLEMQEEIPTREPADRESTKTSRISEQYENGVYRKFRDKFKFVKKQGSVNTSMYDSVKSSLIHDYRIDPPKCEQQQLSVGDYGKLKDMSRRCTLQEAWQSWIGSQNVEIIEESWEDRQVPGEQNLMNTIRNIKASLPS